MPEIVFWILVFIILYTYLGYTALLWFLSLFKTNRPLPPLTDKELPEVTLLIAIYNEREIICQKIENCLSLDYPSGKLKFLWVTDGTTDGSNIILQENQQFQVLHSTDRKGKTAALNRAMEYVKTPLTVFTDANTYLNSDAIRIIVARFANQKTGCVAGEKRIIALERDSATGAGEGIYWNYESYIKKLEASVGSAQGAAGEIYAIRTQLYSPPPEDFVLDDFVVTMSIAQKGYKIDYEPRAIATEHASYNIHEELVRKIRIAAGGFQVLFAFLELLNFKKHFFLSLQYLSHKVLRWTLVPTALLLVFFLNLYIWLRNPEISVYLILLCLQLAFYLIAFLGSFLQQRLVRFKLLFAPFYLCMMNYAIVLGFVRFMGNKQHAAWEKAKRKAG